MGMYLGFTQLRRLRYIALATLVFAGMITSGCGDHVSLSEAALDILTKSNRYPQSQYQLDLAENRLIKKCMTDLGYQYLVEPPPPPIGSDEDQELRLAERHQKGYQLYSQYVNQSTEPPENDRYVRSLPAQEQATYMRALEGSEQERRAIRLTNGSIVSFAGGGCQGASYRALYGDVVDWAKVTYIPQALNITLAKQVASHADYQSAIRRWATCMNERDNTVSDPDQAQAQLKSLYQQNGASPALRSER